jgi:hypothetical protein
MQRGGYPVAPLILALILGPMAEENYRRALVTVGRQPRDFPHAAHRRWPIAAVLLGLAGAVVGLSIWRRSSAADLSGGVDSALASGRAARYAKACITGTRPPLHEIRHLQRDLPGLENR